MNNPLSAEDIFQLSKAFHTLSTVLGYYRYDHWDELSAKQRSDLESDQWTLFNTASDLNAKSVLAKVKMVQGDIDVLKEATLSMQASAKKIQSIKHAINIATKAVALGGAIYLAASTGNAATLIPAASSLIKEINC